MSKAQAKREEMYRALAHEKYPSCDISFDGEAAVSTSDKGAYVQCWVWVSNPERARREKPVREKKLSRIEEINARGFANGWYAQELVKKAKAAGRTMAEQFRTDMLAAALAAYNVPALAVKADKNWIYYQFLDGSKDKYPNTRQS